MYVGKDPTKTLKPLISFFISFNSSQSSKRTNGESLLAITNAETVKTEEELLRNLGFTSVFIYTPLEYAVNDEEQQNVHRIHVYVS